MLSIYIIQKISQHQNLTAQTQNGFHILWKVLEKYFHTFYTHIKKCIFLPRKCLPQLPCITLHSQDERFYADSERYETKGQARLSTNITKGIMIWNTENWYDRQKHVA